MTRRMGSSGALAPPEREGGVSPQPLPRGLAAVGGGARSSGSPGLWNKCANFLSRKGAGRNLNFPRRGAAVPFWDLSSPSGTQASVSLPDRVFTPTERLHWCSQPHQQNGFCGGTEGTGDAWGALACVCYWFSLPHWAEGPTDILDSW